MQQKATNSTKICVFLHKNKFDKFLQNTLQKSYILLKCLIVEVVHFNACLERIKQGDPLGLSELYEVYYKSMLATAVKIVKNTSDAEDIVSDVFKYILKNAYTMGYIKHPKAWLATTMRNKAGEMAKKEEKKKAYLAEFSKEYYIMHAEDIDLIVLLNDSLELLSDVEKEVFDLHFLCGFKYKEISKQLSRAVGTIKSDVFRIREKLKHLEEYV